MKILKWIQQMLSRKLNRKQHEVIRLRWEKAKLEKMIADSKREQKTDS